jgi:dTMP kinase
MKRGLFIVLDGLDGSGKATQSKLLAERLRSDGVPYERIDFPRYAQNFFGGFVGECLAGKHGDFANLNPRIASTLYGLDRSESAPQIRKWLAEGKVIISDRFTSSNQIHQAGKIEDPKERDSFLLWLERMEHDVLGVPRPDAVIYLHVPITVTAQLLAKKRDKKNFTLSENGKDSVEDDETYVRRSYESARELTIRHRYWHMIECADGEVMRTPEAIHEHVLVFVKELLGARMPEHGQVTQGALLA